jgi:two-component system sensor histidine kinase SenX3
VEVFAAGAALLAAAAVGAAGGYVIARRRDVARALPPGDEPGAGGGQAALGTALDTALDAMLTGVVILDGDEVLWANPAATTMRVVGRTGLAPELARLARRARRENATRQSEVDLAAGREMRPVRAVAAPAGTYVALLVDDTTDARRVDAVRRDFVANVSHELKTPVGAMSLLAEAIQDCGDDPDAVRRFAGRMLRESARLSKLIQELIDLSRLQGAEPARSEPVPVRAFVDEAVDRTRLAAAARDIELVVGMADRDLVVNGDAAQLCTAVANLIDNAVAYSPQSTRVSVAARRRDDDVEISVTDQGIGISPADQERVFERFYRVDPARSRETGGTGLGLAVARLVVREHGGDITLANRAEGGLRQTVVLPR